MTIASLVNTRALALLGALALGLHAIGCANAVEPPAEESDLGAAAQAEIDPQRGYTLAQGGITTGAAWRGTISTGADTEYWVTTPRYLPSSSRTFTGVSQSCSDWKRTVCSSEFSGATYYRAVATQTTLDCALPPGPCSPARGSTTLLGAGTYVTSDASGSPYAWTYVSGGCEYWSMDHTVSTGNSTQAPPIFGYASFSAFEAGMCSKSPVPSVWYSSYYEPITDFCSASTC